MTSRLFRHLTLVCLAVLVALPASADTPTAESLVAVDFATGDPDAVVVEGQVKLHRRDVDAFMNLLRAAFEAPVPSALDEGLRHQMTADFKSRGVLGRQAWLKLVDAWPQIESDLKAKRTDAAREGLQKFRLSMDKRLRMFPDARVHQLVARLLKRQSEILMPGPPEVTGLAADVYLDALVFVASLGRNEVVRLTDGQRSVLGDRLRELFKLKSKDDHEAVRKIARTWNDARIGWAKASKDRASQDRVSQDRAFRTRSLANDLAFKLTPEGKQPQAAASSPAMLASRAKGIRRAHGKLDTLSGLSANPQYVWNVLNTGLALEKPKSTSTDR